MQEKREKSAKKRLQRSKSSGELGEGMYDRGPRWSEPLLLLVNLLLLVSLSVNLLAGGAVAGAVGHEDEEIAVLQNLLRLLFVHRHEDNGFVKRAVVRIGRVVDS